MAYTVRNVTLDVEGTQLVARWEWDDPNVHTQEFSVRWWYMTELETWYLLDEQTVDRAVRNSRVAIQEDAVKMWVLIKPISKTYKNSKGNEVEYFTSEYSTKVVKWLIPNPPETPSIPTVDIPELWTDVMRMSVTNVATDDTNYKSFIKFQILQDGTQYINTVSVPVVNNDANYQCRIAIGHWYKVRCRLEQQNKNSKTTSYWKERVSEWSDWTDRQETIPIGVASHNVEGLKIADAWYAHVSWVPPDITLYATYTYKIEYANNIEYFDVTSQTTIIPDISGLQHNVALTYDQQGNNEWFFRVCATNEKGDSKWSDIKSIIIGEPPSAPTTWSSSETAVIGESVTMYWVHNSKDNSKMQSAELELTIDGRTETFGPLEPESSEETVHYFTLQTEELNEGHNIQWRVRTAGTTGSYGEWSISREISIYDMPEVQVRILEADGDDTIDSYPITVGVYTTPLTQLVIGYHISIVSRDDYVSLDETDNPVVVQAGSAVYSKYFDNDVHNEQLFTISAKDVTLENNMRYYVQVEAFMDSGLSATSYALFTPAWSESEFSPNAEIGVDEALIAVNIRPYCVDDDGDLISNILLSVYRIDYDGSLVKIEEDIPNNGLTFVTDPHPPLNYARYRIVAQSSLTGAISYYDLPSYPIDEKAVIIQWNDWERTFLSEGSYELNPQSTPAAMLRLPYNIDVSDRNDMDVALVEYIGRKHPVSYYGTQVGSSATWNVEIDKKDAETLYALRQLAVWQGDVYVREPSGSGYWAHVSVSFSQVHRQLTIPVTLDIVRVEGGA